MTDLLRVKLEQGGNREAIAQALIDLALTAKDEGTRLAAIKYCFDRMDGKPVETVKTEDGGGIMEALDRVLLTVQGELSA